MTRKEVRNALLLRRHLPAGPASDDRRVRLPRASLRGEQFESEERLVGAELQGADLRDAILVGVDLTDADLRGADLADAQLARAVLRRANLAGACLRGSRLNDADLEDADLTGACLDDASLQQANLRGATTARSSWKGARALTARGLSLALPESLGAVLPGDALRLETAFERPSGGDAVAWHPHFDVLAIGGQAEFVVLLDVRSNRPIARLRGADHLERLAWSPDGSHLAGAGKGGEVVVWHLTSGSVVARHTEHTRSLDGLTWSPQGTRLASASEGKLLVWDPQTAQVTGVFEGQWRIDCIAWSPIDSRIAVRDVRSLRLVDSESAEIDLTVDVDSSTIFSELAWSPDGAFLAASQDENRLKVWAVESGDVILNIESRGSAITLAWGPNGHRLAAAGTSGRITVWEPTTGEPKTLRCYEDGIVALGWSPDGQRLASAGERGGVRIWDLRDRPVAAELIEQSTESTWPAVSWSPTGKYLAVDYDDGQPVQLWNLARRRATPLRPVKEFHRQPLSWSPDGSYVSVVDGAHLGIWDVTGAATWRYLAVEPYGESVAWSPRGRRRLAFADSIGTTSHVRIRDFDAAEPEARSHPQGFEVPWHQVTALAWSPDGTHLALSGGGEVGIWDGHYGSQVLILPSTPTPHRYSGEAQALAWSPDGKLLAAAYPLGGSSVWDVATSDVIDLPGDLGRSIGSLAWSPRGDLVVAGLGNGMVWVRTITLPAKRRVPPRLRHAKRGKQHVELDIDVDGCRAVAVTPTHVALARSDGWTTVVDLRTGQPTISLAADGEITAWVTPDGDYAMNGDDGEPPIWATTGLSRLELADVGDRTTTKRLDPSVNPCSAVAPHSPTRTTTESVDDTWW